MTTLFSETFEANDAFASWSGTNVTTGPNESLAYAGGSAKNGSFGIHAVLAEAGGGSSWKAEAYKYVTTPTSHYARGEMWFRPTQFSASGFNNAGSHAVLGLPRTGGSGSDPGIDARIVVVGGSNGTSITLQGVYVTKTGTATLLTGTLSVPLNAWRMLRLTYDWTTSASRVITFSSSTDGVTFTTVGTATDTSYGAPDSTDGVNGILVGVLGSFENGTYALDMDDVALYDAAPAPTIAITGPNGATTLPSNHNGNITLTLTGSLTKFSADSVTFAVSGVAGWAKVSQSVSSDTAATVVVSCPAVASPPAGATGSLTVTDQDAGNTGGAASGTVAVATPTLAASPTGGSPGTAPSTTFTGTNTLWQGDNPQLTLAGGTGASIGASTETNNTQTAATVTYGSQDPSTLTITDPSTGARTTISVSSGVPSAPTIGVAVAGDGLATVYWTAGGNGGSPFTAWRITATPAPGGGQPADITTFPTTRVFAPVIGLTNGTAYTFTVKAVNTNGASAASASSNSVTPVAELATWSHDAANPQRTGHTPTEPTEPWSFAWAFNGPDSPTDLTKHLYDAPPDARPVSDGGTNLYVPAGDAGLYAFTLATGAQLWHLEGYTIRCAPVYDPTSTSLIACSLDGNLLKINPTTGAITARFWAGAKLRRSPLVVGSYVYVVNDLGQMVKLTISDFSTVAWTGTPGSGTWAALTTPTAGVPAATTPPAYSAASDCLIFGTSDLYVRCVKNSDGTQLWAVKPTNMPTTPADPYTFEGGWPVIAEQHKVVFLSMQILHAEMGNYDASLTIATNAQARTYVDASTKQSLFALNLADGSRAFVPAVGYGSVESIRGGSTYGQGPSQLPVIYVEPTTGIEVALCQFRTNVSSPPDYRWDGHLGMMVLDAVTLSPYVAGDCLYAEMDSFASNAGGGLVTGQTSYLHIVDERSPLTMAGASIFHHHWGAVESTKLTSTPSSGKGTTTADPIRSTAHKPVLRDLRSATGADQSSHYSTSGTLQLVEDSRTWVGAGWFGYLTQSCPPAGLLEPGSFSAGLRSNYGYAVGRFLVLVDNSGGLFVLGHQNPTTNATDVAWSGPASGPAGVASSGLVAQLKPLGSHAAASVVVTPSDGGAGGTFAPTTRTLTDTNPVGTFSYTPASAATGTKTLTAAANNGAGFGTSPTVSFTIAGAGGGGGAGGGRRRFQ